MFSVAEAERTKFNNQKRVIMNAKSFSQEYTRLNPTSRESSLVRIRIEDAEVKLRFMLDEQLRAEAAATGILKAASYLDEYKHIAEWLTDNHGKGLLCYGSCGRGKSLLCTKILPTIINVEAHKIVNCYNATDMNEKGKQQQIFEKHLVCIDDLGTEDTKQSFSQRVAFNELVDDVEKKGKLLLVTTNKTPDEIASIYGERTMSRLRAVTKPILFKGEDLRG